MFFLGPLVVPAYHFPLAQPVVYQADMNFDGYLPILGIGEGKATVHGTFEVVGKSDSTATAKLTAFTVTFNGEKIPLDLDDAQKYVPGGTFEFAPNGQVSKWDAPTVVAPIRVPGLDLKHLPAVLFLPVAFPSAGVEPGKSFEFSLPLSGGTADYTVTPGPYASDSMSFTLKLHQTYSDYEDDANQVVDQKDAAARVTTDVEGVGSGLFSCKLGRFVKFHVADTATSVATDLATKKVTKRQLHRNLVVSS